MQEVKPTPKPPKKPLIFYYIVAMIVVMLLNALLFPSMLERQVTEVSYSEFLDMVDQGEVDQVALDESEGMLVFVSGEGRDARYYKTGIWPDDGQRLLNQLRSDPDIEFRAEIPTQANPLLSAILTWVLPILFFLVIGELLSRWMVKKMGGKMPTMGNAMSFGKADAKIYVEAQTGKTFADVAGQDEAKESLMEVVDFLHEPDKYAAIARATSGASGAELANIINEAALRAVRLGRRLVTQADLEESVETVIAGAQRKNAVLSPQEKKIVAYHEIGHALVAAKQTDSAPVTKITIVPRTSGALGYTMQVDQDQRNLMSRAEIQSKIATFTGGRAAEELIFGPDHITSGASNDIEQATKLARAMITRFGMTQEFDMVALETVQNQYLGGDTSLTCSAETAARVDEQVVAVVKEAHQKALQLLRENEGKLRELAEYLLEKETITGEEFMAILNREA